MKAPESRSDYPHRVLESTREYVADLFHELGTLQTRVHEQERETARLRRENAQLLERLAAGEAEARPGADSALGAGFTSEQEARYAEIERQNQDLANLYVASFQLHGSPEREQVLEAMKEIIVNLVGSEDFGVWEISGQRRELVAAFGDRAPTASVEDLLAGEFGRSLETGETIVCDGADAEGPLASIPLRRGDGAIGGIAIFGLLSHKPALEQIDHELFELLAAQAASALYLAELHEARQP